MTLTERLAQQGRRLFAFRSVVPLLLLPVVVLAMPASWQAEAWLGPTGALVVQWLAVGIACAGVLLRCAAVGFAPDGTSSRDTHRLRAPALNTTGMYSVVRHPLYLGNALMWIGVAMSLRVWWLVVIVALVYWIYIERVMLVEEAFLRQTFGVTFEAWAVRTPAFVPRFSRWTRPTGSFSWKRLAAAPQRRRPGVGCGCGLSEPSGEPSTPRSRSTAFPARAAWPDWRGLNPGRRPGRR